MDYTYLLGIITINWSNLEFEDYSKLAPTVSGSKIATKFHKFCFRVYSRAHITLYIKHENATEEHIEKVTFKLPYPIYFSKTCLSNIKNKNINNTFTSRKIKKFSPSTKCIHNDQEIIRNTFFSEWLLRWPRWGSIYLDRYRHTRYCTASGIFAKMSRLQESRHASTGHAHQCYDSY